jgi:hypothetical protein
LIPNLWAGRPALPNGGAHLLGRREKFAFAVLALFAAVELGDRAVVAHHAGPDFAALTFVFFELWVVCFHGIDQAAFWWVLEAEDLAARRSASQIGQNSCSPAM